MVIIIVFAWFPALQTSTMVTAFHWWQFTTWDWSRLNSSLCFFLFLFACFLHSSAVLLDPRFPAPRLHLLSDRRPRQQRGALGLRPRLPSHRQRHGDLSPHAAGLPRLGLPGTCVSRWVCLRIWVHLVWTALWYFKAAQELLVTCSDC